MLPDAEQSAFNVVYVIDKTSTLVLQKSGGDFNIIEADREPHAPKATGERIIYICGKMFIYIRGLGRR